MNYAYTADVCIIRRAAHVTIFCSVIDGLKSGSLIYLSTSAACDLRELADTMLVFRRH